MEVEYFVQPPLININNIIIIIRSVLVVKNTIHSDPLPFRVYQQLGTQWDDPTERDIYYLVESIKDDACLCYRYEVSRIDRSIAILSPNKVEVQRRWFVDKHQLVENQNTILREIQTIVKAQVREAMDNAVKMTAFSRYIDSIVEKSIPDHLEEQGF